MYNKLVTCAQPWISTYYHYIMTESPGSIFNRGIYRSIGCYSMILSWCTGAASERFSIIPRLIRISLEELFKTWILIDFSNEIWLELFNCVDYRFWSKRTKLWMLKWFSIINSSLYLNIMGDINKFNVKCNDVSLLRVQALSSNMA